MSGLIVASDSDPMAGFEMAPRAAAGSSTHVRRTALGGMVGISLEMQRLFDDIRQMAPTSASILITGESGTGKEIAAKTIHDLSRRSEGPFIALNCAALP